MTKRFSFLIAFVAAFLFTAPLALAAPPDAGAAEAPAAEAPADAAPEAPEAKAEDVEGTTGEAGTGDTGGDTDGEAEAEEKLGDHVDAVVEAARSGEWALMVSAIIMLVLGAGRKFKLMDKVPSSALPWVSVALGVVAVVGDSLASGGEITVERLMAGVMAGAAASGLWGLIGKHILGKKKE